MASFVRVVEVPAGLLGVSERVGTLKGSYSPLWTSADGNEWQELGAATLGSTGVVLSMHSLRGRLTALTVSGDENVCPETDQPMCWLTRAPLRAWTSVDGTDWTLQAEPMNLTDDPTSRRRFTPLSAATAGSIIATHRVRDDVRLAVSADGVTWQTATPPEAFVDGWVTGLVAVANRYVAIGAVGNPPTGPSFVAWSNSGLQWHAAAHPPPLEREQVIVATARDGAILEAWPSGAIGPDWWSSPDGDVWSKVDDFAPLGLLDGDPLPSGSLVGDGDRMVAYEFDGMRAWSSFNGVDWTPLTIAGDLPPRGPVANALQVLTIGLLYRDGAGGVWFGDPAAD